MWQACCFSSTTVNNTNIASFIIVFVSICNNEVLSSGGQFVTIFLPGVRRGRERGAIACQRNIISPKYIIRSFYLEIVFANIYCKKYELLLADFNVCMMSKTNKNLILSFTLCGNTTQAIKDDKCC